jgi:hypothetical protein
VRKICTMTLNCFLVRYVVPFFPHFPCKYDKRFSTKSGSGRVYNLIPSILTALQKKPRQPSVMSKELLPSSVLTIQKSQASPSISTSKLHGEKTEAHSQHGSQTTSSSILHSEQVNRKNPYRPQVFI